jgi:hypothetical protein
MIALGVGLLAVVTIAVGLSSAMVDLVALR